MKKVLIILLSLMLCACSNSKKNVEGEYLYKVINNENINNIDTNYPLDIEILDDELGCGFDVTDEEQINILVSLFNQIKIKRVVEEFDAAIPYSLNINFGSDVYNIYFYDSFVEIYEDDKTTCYELDDAGGLKKYVHDLIAERFELDVTYVTVLNYEGVTVQQGSCKFNDSGDYNIELLTNNSTDDGYAIKVTDLYVNGYNMHTYQEFGMVPQNEVGYTYNVPTALLKEYGIEDIAYITYVVSLYEYDADNYVKGDYITESERQEIGVGSAGMENWNLNEPIYADEDIEVYCKLIEYDYYSALGMMFVNNSDEDIDIEFVDITFNDTSAELVDNVYSGKVDVGNRTFGIYPLFNYEYDSETYEVTKNDIETLSVVLRMYTDSYDFTSDVLTIK